jgi:beta-galactosidase
MGYLLFVTYIIQKIYNKEPVYRRVVFFATFFAKKLSIIGEKKMKKMSRKSRRFYFLFFAVILLFFYPFYSRTFGQNIRTQNQPESMRLIEGWEFIKGDLGGVWEALRSTRMSPLPVWEKVGLPHCVNAYDAVDPDVAYYQGPMWYRNFLRINNPFPDGRTLLHFEGAGQKTEVYVETQKVGSHIGGYDEFTIDITDAVAAFKNQPRFIKDDPNGMPTKGLIPVVIRCDNSRDLEMIPSDLSDFNLYGGIYRYLNLVYVPAVSLERVHINSQHQADGRWSLSVQARLYNPRSLADELSVTITIVDPANKTIYSQSRNIRPWGRSATLLETNLTSPVLWSPQSPSLYRCIVTLESPYGRQDVEERFGFRWFEFLDKGPFQLNGQRLLLRGTHRHEDHAGLGQAMTEELMHKEMVLVKEMGVNFIRLGHYQQSRIILDLCDELGILVWEEIPWCRGGLSGVQYKNQARDMLRAMIDQHMNHPAVIIWGLGNEDDWPGDFEIFDREAIRSFMSELNDLAHQLDPGRRTAIRRCDFCKDIVDVYSPSIWAGWYRGRFTEYKDVSRKEMETVDHFLHAEWGGDSHARRHSENPYEGLIQIKETGQADERGMDYLMTGGNARASRDGNWSESYICDLIDWHLKEQETMDWLTGSAQWIFKDFSTPLRPENPVPYVNQKGVVERDLTKKEAYYVFQSYWTDKPMVRIYAHSWPIRWGKKGEKKLVKVYSNCPEAELFINGVSAGKKQRDSQDFPAAGLRWSVVFNEGANRLKAAGVKDGVEVTDEVTFQYESRTWGKPARLSLDEVSRRDDIVTIRAYLFDDKGVPCLDARDFVRFGLTGDGHLLDNLGTSTGSRYVQLYNGRAEISLKTNGGSSTASVTCEGCPTAFLSIASDKDTIDTGKLQNMTNRERALEVAQIDRKRILRLAGEALEMPPVSITYYKAKLSEGGIHDFYSNGDYWWPDPNKADGLPYIQRDGQSNPDNFSDHRLALRQLRNAVAALAAAYALDGREEYARKAVTLLKVFFLDEATRMNPSLLYAQAIPGRVSGRGIGIIDTLQLAEVPLAIMAIDKSEAMTPEIRAGLKKWFADYSEWMTTHPYGVNEMNAANNHSVAYMVQLATFAKLTSDAEKMELYRKRYKEYFLPKQMAHDGSFPQELRRTKPYGYSVFQLDNMAILCQLLSTANDNLWTFTLPDGRGIQKGMEFLFPYLKDKTQWPYPPDVEHFEAWPVRQPSLLFAGYALGETKYIELWTSLEPDPADLEVRRNMAVTQPLLWLIDAEDVPLFGSEH